MRGQLNTNSAKIKGTMDYSRPQAEQELSLFNASWCVSLQVSEYEIYLHIETMLYHVNKKLSGLPYVSIILCR